MRCSDVSRASRSIVRLTSNDFDSAPAGLRLFHATDVASPGVSLDPARLSGCKWFTPRLPYARSFAGTSWHEPDRLVAIFEARLRAECFFLRQVSENAWHDFAREHLRTPYGIEREVLSDVLALTGNGAVGLHTDLGGGEYLIADVEQYLVEVAVIEMGLARDLSSPALDHS